MAGSKEPIIRRCEKNPILTRHDVPYPVETVHNAGVVKHNGKYVMLFRSHLRNGRSIIGLAESSDGVHNVVFCCGAVAEDDGTVKIYWGGADTVMCVGTAMIADLVDLCLSNPRPALE